MTPPFQRINRTKIFLRIIKTTISTNLLDQNICSSLTLQFLRVYSMDFCIHDTSISTYQLDQNILSHPQQLNFFVSTRPKYSIASSTSPFLHIYSTRIFAHILNTSISSHQELDRSILLHARKVNFFVSTRPKHSFSSSTTPFDRIHLTTIFNRILYTSISSYLLNQNILRIL